MNAFVSSADGVDQIECVTRPLLQRAHADFIPGPNVYSARFIAIYYTLKHLFVTQPSLIPC